MGAGLEGDVDGGAGRVLAAGAGVLERGALGVQASELGVEALADHIAVADDHGADQRVRAHPAAAALGQLQRLRRWDESVSVPVAAHQVSCRLTGQSASLPSRRLSAPVLGHPFDLDDDPDRGARGARPRSYGQRASLLSIGVALTGLITYLYFVIASHELSKEEYGEIAVLWSAVFILVSTLQRPVEQLLSRSVSEHIAVGRPYSHPLRVAATIQLGISVVFVVVAIALRGPIEDGLLDGNDFLFWVGVAAVAAYGASYFARGFLAGSHRLTAYAMLIISESVSRTAFPLAVAVGIADGPGRGRAGDRRRADALADRRPVRLPAPRRRGRRAGGRRGREPAPSSLPKPSSPSPTAAGSPRPCS